MVEVVLGAHLKKEAPDRFLEIAGGIVSMRAEVVEVSS